MQITEPASVLAFRRKDGSLYVVAQESSFPRTQGAVDAVLTLHGPSAAKAQISCAKRLEEESKVIGQRRFRLRLEPNEVVPIVITGMDDKTMTLPRPLVLTANRPGGPEKTVTRTMQVTEPAF